MRQTTNSFWLIGMLDFHLFLINISSLFPYTYNLGITIKIWFSDVISKAFNSNQTTFHFKYQWMTIKLVVSLLRIYIYWNVLAHIIIAHGLHQLKFWKKISSSASRNKHQPENSSTFVYGSSYLHRKTETKPSLCIVTMHYARKLNDFSYRLVTMQWRSQITLLTTEC